MQRTAACIGRLALPVGWLLVAGCAECKRQPLQTAQSQDGIYLAEAYAGDCGPATPYNYGVSITFVGKPDRSKEVLRIVDALFEPSLEWLDSKTLLVTIDCPLDSKESCLPVRGRSWRITKETNWEGVQVRYAAGKHLVSFAPESITERILK
jgi:hypothetical protein